MRLTFASCLCLLLFVRSARAQDFGPWHVLGRFASVFDKESTSEPTAAEKLLAQMAPGKEGPDLSITYKGMNDEVIRWRDLAVKDAANALDVGVIDLNAAAPPPASLATKTDNATCYLYRRIDVASDVQLAITMGSDDGLRAWLNGELITDAHFARVINVRDNYASLRLRAGANHLLVKVTNASGPFTFQLVPWTKVSPQAVNAAIDRGVEFLLQSQLIDGSWGFADDFGGGHAAFTAYTLLKCGVRKDHPVVRMAFAAADHRAMETTYSLSALVLALTATGDESVRSRVQEACRQLIDWQDSTGLYGYPMFPGDPNMRPVDLSCTLFAALALRAASHAGVQTADAVWKKLAAGTMRCLEREHEVDLPGSGRTRVAGFSYRIDEGPTGSMTTAGLSVLAIVDEETHGRLPPTTRAEFAAARERALGWVRRELTWTTNPGAGASHHYYWIYGIERAATLLTLDKIGAVDWYQDGAAYLIGAQKGDGSWNTSGTAEEEYMDTLLALLFLRRATQSTTGESTRAAKVAETQQADAEVALRATGDSPLTIWVTNLRGAAIDQLAGGEADVEKIEYLARQAGATSEPELLGAVPGARAKPTDLQRFALQHRFERGGAWLVSARVWLRSLSAQVLKSPELEVHVAGVLDPARLEYAGDSARNLLLGAPAKFASSSSRGDNLLPAKATDGRFGTRWMCDVTDENPWIRISPERSLKADRVVLAHGRARTQFANAARATRIEVIVNGKDHFTADMNPDVLTKTSVPFGQAVAVKQLEVRVLATRDRVSGTDAVGFSEIELQRGR